jgi:hypothetical protein
MIVTDAAVEPQALYEVLRVEMEPFAALRVVVFDRCGLTSDPVPEEVLQAR